MEIQAMSLVTYLSQRDVICAIGFLHGLVDKLPLKSQLMTSPLGSLLTGMFGGMWQSLGAGLLAGMIPPQFRFLISSLCILGTVYRICNPTHRRH